MSNVVKVRVPLKSRDKPITLSGASQSGMGVFYQAIPDVGADGKNVMKLIPVQRVNGQFVRTQVNCNLPNTSKNPDTETQRVFAQPIHFTPASCNNIPVTRYVLRRPSDMNFTVNPVSGTGNLQERVTVTAGTPIQVHVPIVTTTKVAQNVVPAAPPVLNCGKTIALLNKKQLPVALKSPALPSGHYLQIPPNAEVKTLPASALPQAIKKRILTPPENSSADVSVSTKSLPTVVYVSPVNTMKLNSPPPAASLPAGVPTVKPPVNTCVQPPSVPSASSTQPSKIHSKANQAPVTPFKWVVQERSDGLMKAPFLVPQDTTMTSDILKAFAQIEKTQTITISPYHKDKPSVSPGKDNALVMCNGKMYFVAKKMPEFDDQGLKEKTNENNGGPSNCLVAKNTNYSPNQSSGPSPGLPKSKVPRRNTECLTGSNKVDEVIDLCDDDPQEECVSQKLQGSSSVKPAPCRVNVEDVEDDEDSNVIFVSYIPPKSSTTAAPERRTPHENLPKKEAGIEQEKEIESCEKTKIVIENVTSEEGVTKQKNETFEEPGTIPPMEKIQEEGVSTLLPPRTNVSITVSERENTPENDEQLKRRFGITADVKVFLQRIPSPELKASPKKVPQIGSINKRTLDGIRKLILNSRIEMKTKKLIETQVSPLKREKNLENNLHNVKRKKEEHHENRGVENTSEEHLLGPEGLSEQVEPSSAVERVTGQRDKTTGESFATSEEASDSTSTSGAPEPMEVVEQAPNFQENPTEESDSATVSDGFSSHESGLETGIMSSSTILPSKVTSPTKGKGRQCRATQTNVTCNLLKHDSVDVCDSSSVKVEFNLSRTPNNKTRSSKVKAANVGLKQELEHTIPMVTSRGDKEPASVEIRWPPTLNDLECSIGEPSCSDLFSVTPMDPEEIKRHEKIKRLKELLKEKEAALEIIRKNML